jgi:hypothetical protein
VEGQITFERGTTPDFMFGSAFGGNSYVTMYMGSTAVATPGTGNYAFLVEQAGGLTALNDASALSLRIANTEILGLNSTGTRIPSGLTLAIGSTVTFGGGAGVIGLAKATTNPSTSVTTGSVIYSDSSTGALSAWGGLDADTLAPASTSGTGGFGSGVRQYPEYRMLGMATTSYSPGFSMPIPATSVCNLDYIAEARCTNALGACNALGVGASATFTVRGAVVKNISSTASIVTTVGTPTATAVGDTGAASMGCALSAATTFVTLSCGKQSDAQTSDWTIRAKLNCN